MLLSQIQHSPNEILNTNIPRVKRMDGIYWDTRVFSRNDKLNNAALQSDLVIFISKFSQQSFHTLYPKLKIKSEVVVLNDVDDTSFYNCNIQKHYDFACACTNWDREEKRFDDIMLFAEYLKTQNKTLLMIGKNTRNLPSNVIGTGYISDYTELNNAINSAKYFVNFSFRDAGCKCVAQAVKCNLPVLYANSGGVPELVNKNCVAINDVENIYFANKVPALKYDNMVNGYNQIMKIVPKELPIKSYQKTIESYFNNTKYIMKYFIPTYDQAQEIVKSSEKFTFVESQLEFNNYTVSTFSYRHATVDMFLNPIKNKSYDALEFKGLTYIFDKNGNYNHFLMLHKFWILNQYENSKYDLFKSKQIKNVYIKEDGNLITFVKFPDGYIHAKTKNGFKSNVVVDSMKLYYNDDKIQQFVSFCLDNNYSFVFEFVSENHPIVINYTSDKLILLRIRNNITGEYIDIDYFNNNVYNLDGISLPHKININSLDELIMLSKTATNIEGWIIMFDDDTMLKLKTTWYNNQNKYINKKYKTHLIILALLNENKDELLSTVNLYNHNKRVLIDEIENKLKKYLAGLFNYIESINLNVTRKELAMKYKSNDYFQLIMTLYGKDNSHYDLIISYLKTQLEKNNTNLINKILNY